MSDDFIEHINPIQGSPEVEPVKGRGRMRSSKKEGQSIAGEIVAIRRGKRQAREQHTLDLTVGGEEHTDIILRVPQGAYANLEGKRAVLYIEE